jgi:hypothetical protein
MNRPGVASGGIPFEGKIFTRARDCQFTNASFKRDFFARRRHDGNIDIALMRTLLMAIPDIDDANTNRVAEVTAASRKFLDWERAAVRLKQPTEQEISDHKEGLQILIRVVKILLSLEETKSLRTLQTRLNESWETFHNPMSEAETDLVLSKLGSE